jgi:hypothetical protein
VDPLGQIPISEAPLSTPKSDDIIYNGQPPAYSPPPFLPPLPPVPGETVQGSPVVNPDGEGNVENNPSANAEMMTPQPGINPLNYEDDTSSEDPTIPFVSDSESESDGEEGRKGGEEKKDVDEDPNKTPTTIPTIVEATPSTSELSSEGKAMIRLSKKTSPQDQDSWYSQVSIRP